ncbi:hypothetical protein TYRP_020867 [Tyrophagus putrescentiae]|nr:hypothetical protein TYRP_020867 [Tyrophagus putrescentiae]
MAMTTVLLAALLFLSTTTTFSLAKEGEIDCQHDVMGQLDHYLKEIELVPSENLKHKFPETIINLKDACKINKNIMNILNNLANKCMTGFRKNVMLVALYSVKRSQRSLCRKCVNQGREVFTKCIRETVNNVLKVKLVEDKMKIPFLCCQVGATRSCLMKEAKKVKGCKDEHVETLNSRFNQVSMGTMNLACGQYTEETDRCEKIRIPKGNVTIERGNKSMVMTMFELLDTLPLDEENLPTDSR